MKRLPFLLLLLLASCAAPADNKKPVVVIQTSEGPIKVELFAEAAPITSKNFLDYVDAGFYDGTIFHRVMPDFMIQGGGFEPGMRSEKKTRPPIPNESFNGMTNERGTIAMARTNDPNSATAQFFINVVDNHSLNKGTNPKDVGYCVFGKVIEGMDVVDKIKVTPTGQRMGHDDVPRKDIVIQSIKRAE